ncbi:uncharacterized protein LOC103459382 [Poecilia reticulata]|uniref:uncharacterized protein LOC103459382 n=1 Tax=Poecilia reticulata TaxID=8081 RepID=UPI0004A34290|nr:PREDICTED: uncharacterized protein LOC103459382 [Poecilia reticulata]
MPSCSVSLGLLVLLGGVLAYALPFQAISENLKRSHETIATDLGLTQLDVNRDPLFDFVIRTINTSCQRKEDIQLMNATLDVYMRIFSYVRHHHGKHLLDKLSESKRTEVKEILKNLENKAKELKSRLICQNQNIEDALSELERIKVTFFFFFLCYVDDPTVQKKALAQFLQIYQAASVVAESQAASAKGYPYALTPERPHLPVFRFFICFVFSARWRQQQQPPSDN